MKSIVFANCKFTMGDVISVKLMMLPNYALKAHLSLLSRFVIQVEVHQPGVFCIH